MSTEKKGGRGGKDQERGLYLLDLTERTMKSTIKIRWIKKRVEFGGCPLCGIHSLRKLNVLVRLKLCQAVGMTGDFQVKVGLQRGLAPSPLLVILVMDRLTDEDDWDLHRLDICRSH